MFDHILSGCEGPFNHIPDKAVVIHIKAPSVAVCTLRWTVKSTRKQIHHSKVMISLTLPSTYDQILNLDNVWSTNDRPRDDGTL